jgi:hypothetical protein
VSIIQKSYILNLPKRLSFSLLTSKKRKRMRDKIPARKTAGGMAPRLRLYRERVDEEMRVAAEAWQRANEEEVVASESMRRAERRAATAATRRSAIERRAAITAERRASRIAREGRSATRQFKNRLRERRREEEEEALENNVEDDDIDEDDEWDKIYMKRRLIPSFRKEMGIRSMVRATLRRIRVSR